MYPFVEAGYEPTPADEAASKLHQGEYKDDSAASTLQYMAMLGNSNYCAIRRNEHLLRVHTTAMTNMITMMMQMKSMMRNMQEDMSEVKGAAAGVVVKEPEHFQPPEEYVDRVSTSGYK